jgi:hypothetical protein
MKKQISPLKRKSDKAKHKSYEHLGNGYYRDLRTGKIIDKYLSQIISNRPGSKFF